MLKKFEVEGFKNFAKRIVLDFTDVRGYKFNPNCVKDGLLNKIIVYGKNGVGKTNLGLALFDITTHLTDMNVTPGLYNYYLNADGQINEAVFKYTFQIGQAEIIYSYSKSDIKDLIFEELCIDGVKIFSYDFLIQKGDFEGLYKYVPSLNLNFKEKNLSVVKYIVANSKNDDIKTFAMLYRFITSMLWFRSLDENRYVGYKTDSSDYYKFIFENNNLNEFENFLHKAGIKEKLLINENPSGKKTLYFEKFMPLPFFSVASNGTKALYTIFYWLKTSSELSFLFIDEFDAFYHVELAEAIVKMLEDKTSFQTILTSHNTRLLSNRIMRPDCYFILTPEKLISFPNATNRELREGHHLENLYINGEFDE